MINKEGYVSDKMIHIFFLSWEILFLFETSVHELSWTNTVSTATGPFLFIQTFRWAFIQLWIWLVNSINPSFKAAAVNNIKGLHYTCSAVNPATTKYNYVLYIYISSNMYGASSCGSGNKLISSLFFSLSSTWGPH